MSSVAPYKNKAEWLEVHRTGIGGSEVAAVVGLDPYTSPEAVWRRKVYGEEEIEPNADMRRGNRQEPNAADLYVEKTGRKLRRQPLRRHPEHAFMICDIDRQIVGDERGPGLLEIKVPRVPKFFQIREEGLPREHIVQLHHNMIVWGYSWSSFAIYTPEYDDLTYFDVRLDEELGGWLIQRERDFWMRHVVPGVRPTVSLLPPDAPIPEVPGEAEIREDEEWREAAAAYAKAESDLEWAKKEHEEAKSRLLELASGGEEETAFYVAGCGVSVKRSWCEGRTSWKATAERLADEAGLDISAFQVEGKPYARDKITVTAPEEAFDE